MEMCYVYDCMTVVSPVISIGVVNTAAVEEENVKFKCQATYSIDTNITWKFNGDDIDISDVNKYRIMKMINATVIESTLEVMSVTLSNVGIYTCVAENEAGNDTSSGVLIVHG